MGDNVLVVPEGGGADFVRVACLNTSTCTNLYADLSNTTERNSQYQPCMTIIQHLPLHIPCWCRLRILSPLQSQKARIKSLVSNGITDQKKSLEGARQGELAYTIQQSRSCMLVLLFSKPPARRFIVFSGRLSHLCSCSMEKKKCCDQTMATTSMLPPSGASVKWCRWSSTRRCPNRWQQTYSSREQCIT